MTEKRFISKDESIINVATDELVNASSEESAEIIVDWLNEFAEKNGELQNENKELKKKLESKQRLINAYENYIETLKEEGVLDD